MNSPADLAKLNALVSQAWKELEIGRADSARLAIDQLCARLPGHPMIERLKRSAVIVGFDWPAQRAPHATTAGSAPDPSSIDVVSFHVDLPKAPSGVHDNIDYRAVLALSFESAQLRAPRARRVLLTDEATAVPPGMKVDEVMRFPMNLDRLMYERMRVHALYLETRPAGRHSVLIDSDIVVNRDPTPIFGEVFDVGLTWREGVPVAPFNGGMIFVSSGDAGIEFFRRARACYDALAESDAVAPVYPQDLRAWWGDQFALALVVGHRAFADRKTDAELVDGIRVRFFPCNDYNFSFEVRENSMSFLASKYFLHFKGNLKANQARYLELMRAESS
jgi:hypothetical protein